MSNEFKFKIGILAFGSLISNPGEEIKKLTTDILDCETPFKVEFARISSSRGNAPTLIPVEDTEIGKKVNAKIFVLNSNITIEEAKSVLYSREIHSEKIRIYKEPTNPTSKNVLIKELDDFCSVNKVIYTYFLKQEEYANLTPEQLAKCAINSILSEAGRKKKDGISYLLEAKKNGIVTELSLEYERKILEKTNTSSLEEAIEKLSAKYS